MEQNLDWIGIRVCVCVGGEKIREGQRAAELERAERTRKWAAIQDVMGFSSSTIVEGKAYRLGQKI